MNLIHTHQDGRQTGFYFRLLREEPFAAPRVLGFETGLMIATPPTPYEELEEQAIFKRDRELKASAWRKAGFIFDIVYRCNLEVATHQEHKDAINAIYVRYLTKRSEMQWVKFDEYLADVKKLTEDLKALGVFQGRYPILEEGKVTDGMVIPNIA
jgi:hypothetical protein